MADERCIDKTQITKVVDALLKVVEKQGKNDLSSALEAEPINLQLCFKKIPSVKNKTIKIPVPHSIVRSTSDVCLFVKDLDKSQRDYGPTVRHYKDLLKDKGVKRHLEVIPLKSLKLEYQPYEAKKNLSNMYDTYLADDRIVRLLPGLLGKHFIARRRFPVQVNLTVKDLKKEINRALSLQHCVLSGRGSTCQVTVAHTQMSPAEITSNIESAVTKLSNSIPGGAINIKNLHLKTISSPALPIYVSLDNNEDIKLPGRKKMSSALKAEEVSTVHNALVKVTRKGRLQLVRVPKKEDAEDAEDPIEQENDSNTIQKSKRKQTEDESEVTETNNNLSSPKPKRKKTETKGKEVASPAKGKKCPVKEEPEEKTQKSKASKTVQKSGIKRKAKDIPSKSKAKRKA